MKPGDVVEIFIYDKETRKYGVLDSGDRKYGLILSLRQPDEISETGKKQKIDEHTLYVESWNVLTESGPYPIHEKFLEVVCK